jgi:single-strand DNA-binding protein
MKDVNKVFLMGHLGSDPTLRQTKAGLSVAQFRLATSLWASRKEEKDSQAEPETTVWHTIVTWSKTAETCAQHLKKGDRVYLEGVLKTRKYDTQKGESRLVHEVHADRVYFQGSSRKRAEAQAAEAIAS